MLRKLGISVAIASAVMVQNVNALGMGEIRVRSALNEPLYAEIQLLQVKNLSPLQIKSRLADLNDFALANLATQRALSDVRFQVRVNRNGTGRVILTSKLPVTEPFMNFLVEVNWPSGRLVREYTLLLDPPSYNAQQNDRNYQQPAQQAAAPKPRISAVNKPKIPAVVAKRSGGPELKPGQYYIRSKDTLWDIAVSNKPDASVSSRQMMVLIQRKNPHAFPSANINMMKAKQIIELPTKEELATLSAADANKEVQRQTRLWNAGLVPAIAPVSDAVAAPVVEQAIPAKNKDEVVKKAEEMAPEQKPEEEMSAEEKMVKAMDSKAKEIAESVPEKGVLNVVAPDDKKDKTDVPSTDQTASLASSKDSKQIAELLKNNAELDTKLALSQESIDQLQRSGSELNKKLETMAKQLEDISRLIMLKDEQLTAFQQERDDAEQAFEMAEKALREKSWLDKLLESPAQLAALIVGWLLAIGAGVMLLLRRKKSDSDENGVSEKSEPSISLPDNVIEEELDELQSLGADEALPTSTDDDGLDDDLADLGDVDDLDLDLDLDLDMDLDLDESLEAPMMDEPSIDSGEETEDDLAAELDAQLEGEDDDDDLLEGIDSLDFDLGDVEELETSDAMDEEAQARAFSELAGVMDEESADEDSTVEELTADLEDLDIDLAEDDELDELPLEEMQGLPDEELSLEETDLDGEVSVEEMEMDISELQDEAISLEDLEADELLSEMSSDDLDIETEEVAEPAELSLEDELLEQFSLSTDDEDESADPEDDEFSLDSAAMDIEDDEEEIPMDGGLDELLSLEDDDLLEPEVDFTGIADESLPVSEVEVLDSEIDDLLNSTDDDIALDEIQPALDTDTEDAMDFLAGEDGVQMKLDLARAYIEMGDDAGATEIIEEVLQDADAQQREEAQNMLDKLKS